MTSRTIRVLAPLLGLGVLAACATTRGTVAGGERDAAERAAREAQLAKQAR